MNYLYTFIALVSSIILALIVIPKILVIAEKHSLYDVPNERKTHKGNIPRIGGVSFVPCILISLLLTFGLYFMNIDQTGSSLPPDTAEFSFLFSGLLLLYLGGVKDDLVGSRYRHKFVLQIIASTLVVVSGTYINNMYGFLGIHELPAWIGMPLTVLVLVFIINAINLIDGMDGLASGISIIGLCIYGTLFQLHGLWFYAVLASGTVGVLIPFFYYNVFGNARKGKKLFMGDSGSLSLGLILGFLAVRYACYTPEIYLPLENTLVIAVSPILIPMLDVVRVMIVRAKKRRHIFKPDRNHIHHKLMDMGLANSVSLMIMLGTGLSFCIINYAMIPFFRTEIVLLIDIALWLLLNKYLNYLVRKHHAEIKNVHCPTSVVNQ
ncbi:MAG: undecaprenyl/decaprenyl-phosphate alpha-N-acetylglucosaminyl 1-phosphate transferase [Tannerella sp.]|jgi:UDP-N-acetylmuramyl pentapeptide phosphotransferase/UDP-N-acetylglucosamine-1-phosphate transferase|nr:undecaprenyl/decaprenyl-phosphate alpha-N-acetylglucosaminyl 1-phosphate transferase [Tannerella sp.]